MVGGELYSSQFFVLTIGSHGGNQVAVEGSFDNWTSRQTLQRSGKNFTVVKLLPPGVYQVSSPDPSCHQVEMRKQYLLKPGSYFKFLSGGDLSL